MLLNLFFRCSCGLARLRRVERLAWMRLFPALRLYRCTVCGKKQLAPKQAAETARVSARATNARASSTAVRQGVVAGGM
ncbi:hypothetical protein [Acidovorax cavernicola]|uniref:Uncharacterized protein n=1 Tax=Acidovorax cavernicola TaxID=1675792 RepID=A0A9X8D9I4_9BURK|nr:hypothetical protein [Acidovorax cavernicola]RIX84723.1 hypothetical protein D3H34_03640 [Acidovorax cavernicola]